MIGAVTYQLRVCNDGRIEGFAGRLLHAAFFRLLEHYSPELSQKIHDQTRGKPFSISPLLDPGHEEPSAIIENHMVSVKTGKTFFLRISALQMDVLRAAVLVPKGSILQIGRIPMEITNIFADGTHDSGFLEAEDLVRTAVEADDVQEVTFDFISPVSFRRDTEDYPLPDPDLIFCSLADKWTLASMPATIAKERIREITAHIYPTRWTGHTKRVYFGRDRGLVGFTGSYSYSLKNLTQTDRQILLILSQFAVFSGVGRVTAQGFGQTRLHWK